MPGLTLKQGDTKKLTGTVGHADPLTDPLSGASSVLVYARKYDGGANVIDGKAVDTFTAAGAIEYTPTAAESDNVTTLEVYILAIYSDGSKGRFPSAGYVEWTLEPNFE